MGLVGSCQGIGGTRAAARGREGAVNDRCERSRSRFSRRPIGRHSRSRPAHAPGCRLRQHGADPRRIGLRQRARRAPHPRALRPRARPVRTGQLRRDSARPARKRAVRSREGRVHRRADRAHRAVRARGRRHAVPGRDRRHEHRHAGEVAARAPGAQLRASRQRRDAPLERSDPGGDASRSRSAHGRRRVSRGPVLPSQRVSDRRAAAARPAR